MASTRHCDATLPHFDPAYLLESLSIGIAMLDAQLCLMYANPRALDLLGICSQQVRGRPFAALFQDSLDVSNRLRRILEWNEIQSLILVKLPQSPQCPCDVEGGALAMEISPLDGFCTGTHLLVEIAAIHQRNGVSG